MQINKDLIISGTNMTLGDTAYKDVYSTSEVKTGKVWIDGRPIYRKVITGTLPTTNYTTFITIKNLKTAVSENILITMDDGGELRLPFISLSGSTYVYCSYYISGTSYRTHFTVSTYGGKPFSAIVEYTKTTD